MMHGGGANRKGAASNVQKMQMAGMAPVMRGAPGAQGGVVMPQGGGGMMPKGGVDMLGGGPPFNQQQPQLSGRRMHRDKRRAVPDNALMDPRMKAGEYHWRAVGGNGENRNKANSFRGGGAAGSHHGSNNQAAMEEIINRQLYAEAKRAGKLR